MKKQQNNIFLTVRDVHITVDANGKRHERQVKHTIDLGFLPQPALLSYKKTIDGINFRNECCCLAAVKTNLIETKNGGLKLELEVYPYPLNAKCGAIYKEHCPMSIINGDCKHSSVIQFIGKKFRSKIYEETKSGKAR